VYPLEILRSWFYSWLKAGADCVLRIPRIINLNKRPATEAAVVVDGRRPQRARRGDLVFLGYFDDQVEQVNRTSSCE
jgi:hypothetical protein